MPRGRPVLAKLSRPHLHSPVRRTRLFKLLDQRKRYPIVWVSGPPGSGKTTLVASYLETHKLNTYWYQVDEGDRDPATLFYYLGEIVRSTPTKRAKNLPYLSAEHLLDLPGFARHFFRDFFLLLVPNSVVVLDNCHDVDAPIFATILRIAAEQVPQDVRLICVSRVAPNVEFARLEVNDQMLHLDWDELRLTLPEARQIVAAKENYTKSDVEQIYQRADGWVAGLTLLLSGEDTNSRFPQRGDLKSGDVLFRYFAGEIFANATEATRELLLRVSLFPQFTVTMAVQIGDNEQAGQILDELHRKQYFTYRNAGEETVYQFHDLFRGFLMGSLAQTRTNAELQKLQVMAARLLEAVGQPETALELYRAAQAWEPVTRLILQHAEERVDHGRWQTVNEWLAGVPGPAFDSEPSLAYWRAVGQIPLDPTQAQTLLEQAFEQFEKTNDMHGQILVACSSIEVTFYIANTFHPFDRWLPVLANFLGAPSSAVDVQLERRAWAAFLIAALIRQPHHPLILVAKDKLVPVVFADSPTSSERVSIAAALLEYSHFACDIELGAAVQARLGQLLDAEDVAPFARVWGSLWMGVWRYFNADFDAGVPMAERAIELARRYRIRTLEVVARSIHLILCYFAGEFTKARKAIVPLQAIVDRNKAYPTAWYTSSLNVFHVINEDWQANAESNVDEQRLWDASGFVMGQAVQRVIGTAMHLAFGRMDEAKATLLAARRFLKESVTRYCDAIVPALEWKILDEAGEHVEAHRQLKLALVAAKNPKVAAGLYLWAQPLLPEIFATALREQIEPNTAKELIKRFAVRPISRYDANWPRPVKICALGELEIEIDERPYQSGRKSQFKVLELLKVLIAQSGKEAKVDHTAEILWPDVEGDAAAGNLRTALHRLRQMLSNDTAVQLQDGTLSLNREICWLDVRAFDALSAASLSASELTPDEVSQLEQAVNHYRGHLLQGESRGWLMPERERLRARFHQTVLRLAQQWMQHGENERAERLYQQSLEKDPSAEVFYRHLMLHFHANGKLTEAAETYRRCEQIMAAMSAAKPSTETRAVYDSLQKA